MVHLGFREFCKKRFNVGVYQGSGFRVYLKTPWSIPFEE